MKRAHPLRFFLLAAALALHIMPAQHTVAAKDVEFGGVVKLVESHYRVKHKSIPLVARMAVKTAQTAARVIGPDPVKRLAEYGSTKLAIFEDQDFSSPSNGGDFMSVLRGALEPQWRPLVVVRARQGDGQTYIYTREAGEKFKVLIVTIGQRDATVLQVNLRPQALVVLMTDPEGASKTLNDEAAGDAAQQ